MAAFVHIVEKSPKPIVAGCPRVVVLRGRGVSRCCELVYGEEDA
jgi:hypothetical protein